MEGVEGQRFKARHIKKETKLELPYEQLDASWISDNLRGVGGPYTPLTTLDESTGRC